ncbi:MAG: choice-of-anchor Q domain-containing protein [Planctomycetales bacterium]
MNFRSIWKGWRRSALRRRRAAHRDQRRTSLAWSADVLESRKLLTTLTVTDLEDNLTVGDGQLTLREALQAANSNASVDGSAAGQSDAQDQIVFQPGLTGTIHFDSALGQLVISGAVHIQGLGAKDTIIDAGQHSRVFLATSGAGDVGFDGVTISGGRTTAEVDTGGGIQFLSEGILTITNSALTGNGTSGFDARGGAIFTNVGPVNLQNCLIAGNATTGVHGRGIAIYSENAPIRLVNSTISGNAASGYHGGSSIYTLGHQGSLEMVNSTITANFGIGSDDVGSGGIAIVRGVVSLKNSILSGNFSQDGSAVDVEVSGYATPATFTASHSLIGVKGGVGGDFLAPAPLGAPDANGNLIGTPQNPISARLAPLADHGGPTLTHALLAGSPAIDAGSNALALGLDASPLGTDQRGPGFPRIDHAVVDMGSFEGRFSFDPPLPDNPALVVTTADDELDSDLGDRNDLSLREALSIANRAFGRDTIQFAPGLSGVPLLLTLGQLTIIDDVTIQGRGVKETVIDAQGNSRIFDVFRSGVNVTINGVTLTGGHTALERDEGGAIRLNWAGSLTLRDSVMAANSTSGFAARGGGVFSKFAAVTIVNSLLSGNSAFNDGGAGSAIFALNGPIAISNSTISGNYNGDQDSHHSSIYTQGGLGTISLTNSTVTNNSGHGTQSPGGGGVVSVRAPIVVHNSIISGNRDRFGEEFSISLTGYNRPSNLTVRNSLIGSNFGENPLLPAPIGSPDANGNLVGTRANPIDARLGALADNGGKTPTHALLADSPARDAGSNALATGLDGVGLTTDQRGPGFPRIQGGLVDMGAWEGDWQIDRAFLRPEALEGLYFVGNELTKVLRAGSQLTFVNRAGNTSKGVAQDGIHVVATDWSQAGVFDPVAGTISFANGSVWRKVRELGGTWLNALGRDLAISAVGTDLMFTNAAGQTVSGRFLNANTVEAPGWKVTGQLTNSGQRIEWANNTVWDLVPDFGDEMANSAGAPVQIVQSGSSLTFVNRLGKTSAGHFIDAGHVVATDWGNIVGTLHNQWIEWANGSVWRTQSLSGVDPYLGGLWDVQGQDSRILQAGGSLTFVDGSGKFSAPSAGRFVSTTDLVIDDWGMRATLAGGQLTFSNGDVWTRLPDVAGPYLDQSGKLTRIAQLERSVQFTDNAGIVTHGLIVGASEFNETEGPMRHGAITGTEFQWSTGDLWKKLPDLRGAWLLNAPSQPAYFDQSGKSVRFVNETGKLFRGTFQSTTRIATDVNPAEPNAPVITVDIDNGNLRFSNSARNWQRPPDSVLDSLFADPSQWPFV